jgi:RNA ligase (TIGR02306 family)
MRRLATIQIVNHITPIEGADNIEKVRIKGWWCVVRKNEFKIGDKCIYHEIDSLLPNVEQYNFMNKGSKLKKSIIDNGKEVEGYRLKTIKLKGQISQGLALPLNMFPEIDKNIMLDTDVSEILNIYKYNPPMDASISGDAKGRVPEFIPITNEERVQNCIPLLELYKKNRFYITEKIDGTSSTFYKYNNIFGACGHNYEFKESNKNIFWVLAKKYDLPNKFPNGYAIQGETAGPGIQGNRLKLKDVDFFGFYVFDILNYKYLLLDEMIKFVNNLNLKTVPIINDNFILNHSCDELLSLANAKSKLSPNCIQEGMVLRLYYNNDKISFKVISNDYLIKNEL